MSFPAYEEYKDSGVEWLGEVPEHWETMKLGRVTLDRCDGPFGSGLKSSHYVDDGIRVVRLNNIRHNHFDESDAAFIDPAHYHDGLGGGHDVVAGDLLIAGLGDDNNAVGRACVAPVGIEPAMVKADCFRYRLDQDLVLPSFMSAQLTVGAPTDAGLLSTGTTRSRIPLSVTSSRRVSIPPLPEQTAIASFLDVETSKIDSLVSEQRRLIELLKEKRQAVISHAVTKGLNPDVKMKDSGIEWLGEVPEGWEVLALKHLTSLRSGDGITGDSIEESGDYPVFGGNGLRGFTDAFTHDGHYVIIGRQGALCGNVNYGQGKFWASEHAVVATPLRAVDTVWLGEMIRSMNLNQYSETAAQPGLSMVAVGNLRTVLPPIKEQKEIAKFVTNMITEFDSLGAQAERSIELLQERRTALISAAVTGKIDVRQFATEVVA